MPTVARPSAGPPQAGRHPPGGSPAVDRRRGAVITHLLYLHGFRSSPQSAKARLTAAWIAQHHPEVHWWCPQLPPSPRAAMQLLQGGTEDWPADRAGVIGSSLGGFYATALAEPRGWRVAVLNPAVDPARDLQKYIGETTAWHSDDVFFFRPEFIGELQAIAALAPPVTLALARPERCFALIARGDEVLSWEEMAARYRGAAGRVLEGGDHALSDFDRHLPDVMAFFGLNESARAAR